MSTVYVLSVTVGRPTVSDSAPVPDYYDYNDGDNGWSVTDNLHGNILRIYIEIRNETSRTLFPTKPTRCAN